MRDEYILDFGKLSPVQVLLILHLVVAGKIIQAIKLYRDWTGAELKTSKQFVDTLFDTWRAMPGKYERLEDCRQVVNARRAELQLAESAYAAELFL